jgi:hypothetical protein
MNHMAKKGTTFANHFVTTALCCPSRVSLLTGRQAHGLTSVTFVLCAWRPVSKLTRDGQHRAVVTKWFALFIFLILPFDLHLTDILGGYLKFVEREFNENYLWLTPGWVDIGYVRIMCLAPSE